jgi:sugar lactone lactonase YvrE
MVVLSACAAAQPTATPVPELSQATEAPIETPVPPTEEPTAEPTAEPTEEPEPTATAAPPTDTPAPEPTETAMPEPTEEPAAQEPAAEAMAWTPDGVISEGEYADSVQEADVTFHWIHDGEYLYGALTAPTEGWVAVGFKPEVAMQGANYVYGYVADGEVEAFDMWGAQPRGPGSHPPDVDLGGTDDIVAFGGQEADGTTTFEFQIPLDSGDEYDKPLEIGQSHDILLAWGPTDDFAYHGARAMTTMMLEEAAAMTTMPEQEATLPDTAPEVIPLPNGFRPEGIAAGMGTAFFVGSIPTGNIYRGDLATGEGEVLVEAEEGRAAIGLAVNERANALFVAGGPTGSAFMYDAETGESLAEVAFTSEDSFVNDVIVTEDAAYFTDSRRPYFYRVALGPDGALPDMIEMEAIELGGDYEMAEGFNANGIVATPDGQWLIIVQSATGTLFRVDPATGEATAIDLGGEMMTNGDGLLLEGQTLYVVQNRMNQIAVIDMGPDHLSGTVTETLTDPDFDVPTTLAMYGDYLYAVNARFGTEATESTEYQVIRLAKP